MRLPLILAVAAAPAAAAEPKTGVGIGDDPHLAAVARTAGEAARVAAVTAPPKDVSTPEPFEQDAGGAGTNRRSTDADAFSWPADARVRRRRHDGARRDAAGRKRPARRAGAGPRGGPRLRARGRAGGRLRRAAPVGDGSALTDETGRVLTLGGGPAAPLARIDGARGIHLVAPSPKAKGNTDDDI